MLYNYICRAGALLLLAGGWLMVSTARADADLDKVAVDRKAECGRRDWSLEAGAGAAFSNVRVSHLDNYTYVPVELTASLKLDEVGAGEQWGGVLRGYTEFFFRGYWNQITNGPEHRMAGVSLGPRYNFVQPGWKLVPFVEAGVGFGFLDSNPSYGPGGPDDTPRGVGQDFNFMFLVAIGARYDFDENWFVRVSVFYQHFSNGGLSEPAYNNRAVDAVGPELSIGMNF